MTRDVADRQNRGRPGNSATASVISVARHAELGAFHSRKIVPEGKKPRWSRR
jgi:hypothetical protein